MSKLILVLFVSVVFIGSVTAQPKDTIFYQDVSWSPDGSRLLVSRMDISGDKYLYRVFAVDSSGKNYQRLTDGPGDVWTSWSKDGTRFVFASKKDGNTDIYIKDIQSAVSIKLTSDTTRDSHPDWSPDNNRIAFISNRTGRSQLFTIDTTGHNISQLTSDSVSKDNPRWSPDGKQTSYYGHVGSAKDSIYIFDVKEKSQFALCEGIWPSWLPDGKSILFALESNILKINLADRVISKVIDNAYFARYSPNGKKIAFIRQSWKSENGWPATSAVFISNADGSGEHQITPQ